MEKQQRHNQTKLLLAGTVTALSAAIFAFLPVPYTLYAQPNDGNLRPADPVTTHAPLQQCLMGDFDDVTGIDLLLATYGRKNTNINHIEIFTLRNGKKTALFQQEFSSETVNDNDYFSINFPAIKAISKLCFLLSSFDATPQNSITYWLNSQSQPVLKIRSTEPLHRAIEKIAEASRFHLPMWLVIALCLLYLGATVSAIFFIWHGTQKQVSKTASPYPRRTRQKRV